MNAEQIAHALGGKRAGNQFKCRCPAHDDKDPSMLVFDGREAVQVRCMSGCSTLDIIAALKARGLWEKTRVAGDFGQTPAVEQNRNGEIALSIWNEAIGCGGTQVETYLNARGLTLPPSPALRFHPRCPFDRERVPAVVVLMCEVGTGRPCAIQRLRLDGPRKVDAKMLGPANHAAMMLTDWNSTFWDCLSYCPRLFVCEGAETGIALMNAGYGPVWALGSAGTIERLPVLFGVGELIICADHDHEKTLSDGRRVRPGIDAALACRDRWNSSSHQRAEIWLPAIEGQDFADWMRAKHDRGQAA